MTKHASNKICRLSRRVYRYLLYLYPAEFRKIFGEDMAQIFHDYCRAMWRRWRLFGLIWAWLWVLSDLALNAPPEHLSKIKEGQKVMMLKRLFDLILSVVMLILFSPVLLVTAMLIMLESGRPIFYISERLGRYGKPFPMLKFRSLYPDSDRPEAHKPTRIGRLLRQTSLDELPQLINVIKGEMSFIGPRPAPIGAIDLSDPNWRQVLSIRPGLTGPAQISGAWPHDPTQSLDKNLRYVHRHSFWSDVWILLKTIWFTIIRPK